VVIGPVASGLAVVGSVVVGSSAWWPVLVLPAMSDAPAAAAVAVLALIRVVMWSSMVWGGGSVRVRPSGCVQVTVPSRWRVGHQPSRRFAR
jgi:hypothetical protein